MKILRMVLVALVLPLAAAVADGPEVMSGDPQWIGTLEVDLEVYLNECPQHMGTTRTTILHLTEPPSRDDETEQDEQPPVITVVLCSNLDKVHGTRNALWEELLPGYVEIESGRVVTEEY